MLSYLPLPHAMLDLFSFAFPGVGKEIYKLDIKQQRDNDGNLQLCKAYAGFKVYFGLLGLLLAGWESSFFDPVLLTP